tara:strand:- start:22 stop:303 length:282 start_codon:yes stop_codon:yes gene_type:complete
MYNETLIAEAIRFFTTNNMSFKIMVETILNNTFETTDIYHDYTNRSKYLGYYFYGEENQSNDNLFLCITLYACFCLVIIVMYMRECERGVIMV